MGNTLACVNDDGEDIGVVEGAAQLTENFADVVTQCVTMDDDDPRGEFDAVLQDDATKDVEVELEETLSRMGVPVRDFYQVPLRLDKPIGSRILPDYKASRSGAVYAPGEIIEVVQEVTVEGIKYFKTDDKKGWLFIHHPELNMKLLEHMPGNYIIESAVYKYDNSAYVGPIDIRIGPTQNSKCTGNRLFPDEEFNCIGKWSPKDNFGLTFLKLADNKGWVCLNAPGSEKALFIKV